MVPRIEVADEGSKKAVSILGRLLADEYVLSVRTREAERYVNGINHAELRNLFGGQYKGLAATVADINERIYGAGLPPVLVLTDLRQVSGLKDHNERFTKQDQIIEALLDDHESIMQSLGEFSSEGAQADADTAEFFEGLLRQHEEMAKSLRGWLQ